MSERTPLLANQANAASRPGGLGTFSSQPAQQMTDEEILAQESAFSASESEVWRGQLRAGGREGARAGGCFGCENVLCEAEEMEGRERRGKAPRERASRERGDGRGAR
jgi:hypothetical protein